MKNISYDSMSAFQSQYVADSYKNVKGFLTSLVKNVNDVASAKDDKIVYLITGGVAAGKSTLACSFIKFFNLQTLPYVGTDVFYNLRFAGVDKFDADYDNARNYTIDVLDNYVAHGVSFVWETVLSKPYKLEFIKRCKQHGYKIVCVFVCTENLDVAFARSRARHLEGGHYVDEDFIVDRYFKTLDLTRQVKEYFDVVVAFDNTSKLEMIYYGDKSALFEATNPPNWFKRLK